MTYKPGDVILANEPFALAVAVKMIPVVCSWCLKTTKEVPLSVCAGCKTLKYCSSACQKEDWLKGPHKNECKYLKYQIVPGQTRLICRIIFKLRAGLGDAEYQLPDGTKTSYNKTIGHASHVLSKGDGTQELASTWKSVKEFMGKDSQGLYDKVREAHCKIERNRDLHLDNEGVPVADGLNLLSAVATHSCYPNAVYSGVGRKMELRCIRKIEKFSDVRTSYYHNVFDHPRSVRRAMLWASHNFHCRCDECEMKNPGAKEREASRDRPLRCGPCKRRGQKPSYCLDCTALGSDEEFWVRTLNDEETLERITEYAHYLLLLIQHQSLAIFLALHYRGFCLCGRPY